MKICLLNNLYPPLDRGGAEKVVAAWGSQLQTQGHDVFVITTKPKKVPPTPSLFETRIIYLESNYYNLSKVPYILRLFWHIGNIFAFKKLYQTKKIIRREKPNLIISHNLIGLGFIITRAFKKSGAQHHHFLHDIQLLHPSGLMYFKHENIIDTYLAKIYQGITKRLLGSPDKIISPSLWLLQEHQKRGFFPNSATEVKKLTTVLNYDEPLIISVIENLVKPKKLLFAGQLEYHKGVLFLLEAFISWGANDMELIIAGDGQLKNQLSELSSQHKNIKLVGRLNKKELTDIMQASDVLIVPSLCYENSPTIIFEAQAFSLPVIASRLGGIPEIVGPNDKLFNPGDALDLWRQITV